MIGIDRYERWKNLQNAVGDARRISSLLGSAGFEPIKTLLDKDATGSAIRSLVVDDLRGLGPDDSLVLFYAGHGGTQRHKVGDQEIMTGYLIPVDAESKVGEWIELQAWLSAIARLSARHILVVLDACYSGMALEPITQTWRNIDVCDHAGSSKRLSRQIIASALDNELAADIGPVSKLSLFTGCLVKALTRGSEPDGPTSVSGSRLAFDVRDRVKAASGGRQTPGFSTFARHDHGDLEIPLVEPEQAERNGSDSEPTDRKPRNAPWRAIVLIVIAALCVTGLWLGPLRDGPSRSEPVPSDAGSSMISISNAPPHEIATVAWLPESATQTPRTAKGSKPAAAPHAVRARPVTAAPPTRVATTEPGSIPAQVTQRGQHLPPDCQQGTSAIEALVATAARTAATDLYWLAGNQTTEAHDILLRVDSEVTIEGNSNLSDHGIDKVENAMRCVIVTLSFTLEYAAPARRENRAPAEARRCFRDCQGAYKLAIADLASVINANVVGLLSHKQEAP